MNPTEIIPQPNLIVYMKDYTMVTVNSAQYGVIAVIVDISGKEKYPETLKFQWALGTNLYEFVRKHLYFKGDSTITKVASYNDSDYIIFDRDKEIVKVTKEEIAEKFGTIPEYLEIA